MENVLDGAEAELEHPPPDLEAAVTAEPELDHPEPEGTASDASLDDPYTLVRVWDAPSREPSPLPSNPCTEQPCWRCIQVLGTAAVLEADAEDEEVSGCDLRGGHDPWTRRVRHVCLRCSWDLSAVGLQPHPLGR